VGLEIIHLVRLEIAAPIACFALCSAYADTQQRVGLKPQGLKSYKWNRHGTDDFLGSNGPRAIWQYLTDALNQMGD
jgi:hypothetical protein